MKTKFFALLRASLMILGAPGPGQMERKTAACILRLC